MLYSLEDCRLRWLNDLFHAGGEWVTAVGQDWGHWLENYKQSHNFGWGKVNLDSRQSQRFLSDERKRSHFPCVKANTGHEHRLEGQRLSCSWAWCADGPCVVRVKLLMSGTCLEKQKYLSGNRALSCRDGRSLRWSGSFCPKRLSPGCSAWRPAGGVFLSLALWSITLSLNKKTLPLHGNCTCSSSCVVATLPPSLTPSVFLYCLGISPVGRVLTEHAIGPEFNPSTVSSSEWQLVPVLSTLGRGEQQDRNLRSSSANS